MTTETLIGIAGPFSNSNPLPFSGNGVAVIDKVNGTNLVIPAGHVVTEISIRRLGLASSPNLTSGKSVAVGLLRDPAMGDPATDPRIFSGTPGVLTDTLNADAISDHKLDNGFIINLNNTTAPNGTQRAVQRDRVLCVQCGLGSSIVEGGVTIVVKHKPFSKAVAAFPLTPRNPLSLNNM